MDYCLFVRLDYVVERVQVLLGRIYRERRLVLWLDEEGISTVVILDGLEVLDDYFFLWGGLFLYIKCMMGNQLILLQVVERDFLPLEIGVWLIQSK